MKTSLLVIISSLALTNSLVAGESNTAQGSYYSRVYNKEIRAFEDKDLYEAGGYRSPQSYNIPKPYSAEQAQQRQWSGDSHNIPKPYSPESNSQTPSQGYNCPHCPPNAAPSCADNACQGGISSALRTNQNEAGLELADNTPDQTYRPYDLARKNNTSDTELADRIKSEIKRVDQTNKFTNVNILVLNGIPSLTGTVNNENDHKDLIAKVRSVRGVQNVKDQIKVINP